MCWQASALRCDYEIRTEEQAWQKLHPRLLLGKSFGGENGNEQWTWIRMRCHQSKIILFETKHFSESKVNRVQRVLFHIWEFIVQVQSQPRQNRCECGPQLQIPWHWRSKIRLTFHWIKSINKPNNKLWILWNSLEELIMKCFKWFLLE